MRIALVYPRPDVQKLARFGFSYDMLTIAAVLRPYHQVTVRDYSCEDYDPQWFIALAESGALDLLLLECDSFALKRSQNLNHARDIASLLKGRVPIIAYGNYCYLTNRDFTGADYTVRVNDINALLAPINALPGFKPVPAVRGYDALPHIDRDLLSSIEFYGKNRRSTLLQTSKGCKNTCVFCQRKSWQSLHVVHSDDYVLNEFRDIRDRGYENIWLIDENFTFNLVRAKRLLTKMLQESLADGLNLFISSWTNLDMEFLDLAARCNVRIISFGIESGSREILKFYRKNIELEHAAELIRYAGARGICTVGNFIIGAPMETEETMDLTFALIRGCGFDQINIKTLDYMIGSDLYSSLGDSMKSAEHIFACAENGLNGFTLAELIQKKNDFQKKYYAEHLEELAKKIRTFGNPYSL
jgi:hypothetical protein